MGPPTYFEGASVSEGQRLLHRKMEHKDYISYHTCSDLTIHNLAFGLKTVKKQVFHKHKG